jgi:hypothetical protein
MTPAEIADAITSFATVPNSAAVELWLLDQIRIEGGGEVMTPNQISEASGCFACVENKEAARLYLLELMVANGGSGGGNAVLDTIGDPEGVLTANERQFAYDSTNNVLYIHEGASGTNTGWQELVS